MKLEPIRDDESDRDLFERMFCDPIHMKDLGGPQPREKVRLYIGSRCISITVSINLLLFHSCRLPLGSLHTGEAGVLYGKE